MLIAAIADPFDSCSAWAVSSSRFSASAQDSQACTLRDRPRINLGGGKLLVSAVIGGRVTDGTALWLRCRLRCRTWGRLGVVEDGRGGISRDGEPWLETSSALPSRDIDRRT